ncbi:PAS domain-containing sensor histidine kinase [Siccirubricoccus sp. KC 17139]|uniref:histidine kinase n=2 Tax=Siccirubricoccus soli TaxID=2899147 RepID=A0ABT1D2T6_9PROT|nr:PAS domain-containing sensor histidine kinase [Siccirubricoccus soli]MCO6416238.1 PAS domain-containing sensor histidine kinase [Siccirubricoccus soli]MCP2682372.1 PAS domain-containing sensor histidine kinase [Siccirubricoccus soli]
MTLGLAVGALLLGIATFAVLSEGSPFGPTKPGTVVGLVLVNLAVILLLLGSLAGRLVRVWADRRRGSAGSRLHVRLVLLFGVVAVVPAMLVAVFAALFFNLGIETWFSDRVRTALEASLQASRGYLEEHRNTIRGDALAMAADLSRARVLLPDNGIAFARLMATHTALRNLTEAVVFDPATLQVIAHAGYTTSFTLDPPPEDAIATARLGDVAVIPAEDRVRAVVALDIGPIASGGWMLLIGRPLDTTVLLHQRSVEAAVAEYNELDRNRSGLQITFVMIFAIAALLVLLAAVLIGLVLANQLARPIGRLIVAAERVRAGDLATRVEEGAADEEIASLARAFNRMTNQLAAQRSELLQAYRQIDDRRRFTETVLAGVSAGVVGLERDGRVNLPNRRASELLGLDLDAAIGLPLAAAVPEFAPLLAALEEGQPAAGLEKPRTAEIRIGPPSHRRTLLARLAVERPASGEEIAGYVLTFDDITELLSAQRKAAWADVARRIAHEIKNPLTPIQLSAERLKRRYLKQISQDPETFVACTDTIVRQVGDIGRMVDEFSAFARMPQPVIRPEDLVQVARDALVLQRDAHPEIEYRLEQPEAAPVVPCDRRLMNQALVNLLQNAADAIAMRPEGEVPPQPGGLRGHITVRVAAEEEWVHIVVEDDGIGLPQGEERDSLTEPYVTHKAKGTGLGLAIVKKIMEDHGGRLGLEDRPGGAGESAEAGSSGGARAVLTLPWRPAQDRPAPQEAERPDGSMRRAHGA